MKDDERYHFPFFWGHKVCLCLRLFICMCLWWSTKEGATASSACGCSNLGGNSRKAQWFSRVQGPHEQIEMENSDSYFSTEKGQFSFHRTMMCFFPPFFSIGFPFSYLGDTLWLGTSTWEVLVIWSLMKRIGCWTWDLNPKSATSWRRCRKIDRLWCSALHGLKKCNSWRFLVEFKG